MIVVSRGKLKFLLSGRTINVDVDRQYRRHRLYAAGVGHQTICRVHIIDVRPIDGRWRLTIRRAEDKPVYLAANPGAIRADYTEDPTKAAREADGVVEQVDPGWLNHEAKLASDRDDAARRERARQSRRAHWQAPKPLKSPHPLR